MQFDTTDVPSAASADDRLRALMQNAEAGRWSIGDAIDWTVGPAPPRFLRTSAFAGLVAVLEAGERATAEACRRMIDATPDGRERSFLALQAEDEDRHAAAYAAYRARLGFDSPPPPAISAAFDALASWQGPPAGQMMAVHIVLEGEALALQRDALARVRCPLFAAINRLVARDEARHVAFGRIVVPPALLRMNDDKKAAALAGVRRIWDGAILALGTERHVPRFVARTLAAERWAHHARALARMGC